MRYGRDGVRLGPRVGFRGIVVQMLPQGQDGLASDRASQLVKSLAHVGAHSEIQLGFAGTLQSLSSLEATKNMPQVLNFSDFLLRLGQLYVRGFPKNRGAFCGVSNAGVPLFGESTTWHHWATGPSPSVSSKSMVLLLLRVLLLFKYNCCSCFFWHHLHHMF